MSALENEGRALIEEIRELVENEPDRRTLRIYGRALWRAIEAGDWPRVRKGIDVIRPVVDATRELDLVG